jgi:flagellar biosynthesis protein FlhF
MRLKLYRAAVMAEAMARVRAELGEDALILGTRRVSDGVEVTAALESAEPPAPLAAPDPARLAALEFHAVPAALHVPLQQGDLETALANAMLFAALPLGANEQPLVLVGPPGAGKTLTVARLATRLVMAGITPMVITTDGKRAGATEQLAAFTRLLGIDLVVACQPATLARALSQRQQAAPVLVDTAGIDPFDSSQRDELTALADAAGGTMALVLAAGMDVAETTDLARAYAAAGVRLLVGTRFDIARRLGGILAASAHAGLALTEAGIGPGAADGLLPITPAWLASRLLTIPALEAQP